MRLILWRLFWLPEWLWLVMLSEKTAQDILWIPRLNWKYFLRTSFVWDLELLGRLNDTKRSYRVCFGLRSVGKIANCRVYYNPQYEMNLFGDNYETRIYSIVSAIFEENKNIVDPSSCDILFWENKIYMHNRFLELNIPHPLTTFSSNAEACRDLIRTEAKVILKPSHSKSSIGIVEIETKDQLNYFLDHPEGGFILQRVEEIDRDCRIIVVDGDVVLQYWRNKPYSENDKFVSTATGNGSLVRFNDYPVEIEKFAIENTKKLGLKTAAWDLIIVEGKIYALEVSPVYYPNASEGYDESLPYKSYKTSFYYPFYMRREFSKHIFKRVKF